MLDTIKTVLDFLKGQGVEVSDAAVSAAETQFSGKVLAPSDKVLAEGEMKETEAFNREKTQNLQRFKEENRKLVTENKELEDSLLRGDKVAGKKLVIAEEENKRLKAIADKFMADQRTQWAVAEKLNAEGKFPETLKEYYTFAEKSKELVDGKVVLKELDDEVVLTNVAKFAEHQAIGALKAPAPEEAKLFPFGKPPKGSPSGKPAAGSDASWRDLNAAEKIKFGHEHPPKTGGASMGDAQEEG